MKPKDCIRRLPQSLHAEGATDADFRDAVIKDLRAIIQAQSEILRQLEEYPNLSAKDGNVIVGRNVALPTTSKTGFMYIPRMTGATGPTVAPNNYTGSAPFFFDDTNLRLWVYSYIAGAWKSAIVA